MSAFDEFIKSEKRTKTLSFLARVFNFIISIFGSGFIFWMFFTSTMSLAYYVFTYENKFPLICGTIVNMENKQIEKREYYYIYINTGKTIEDFEISKTLYDKYLIPYKTNNNVQYCDTVMDSKFIFFIVLLFFLVVISFISFCNWVG